MRNRRLGDQLLILDGIKDVRVELAEAASRSESTIVMNEILTRLLSMYSLLDPDTLSTSVTETKRLRRIA